ncbi:unnamed protein product [Rotaria sordida]|uniref:Uncharacterized protein n=2 Tax=Rotaria sordida TaxID=392033 RepID=A0A814T3G8_9BILA|nr:unnamed protein product [Rotaria sordida]CAF1156126.1 unnamed protein product [Rotaria sordida]CAF3649417.1 unnamed protein product [Rotaria sordida]
MATANRTKDVQSYTLVSTAPSLPSTPLSREDTKDDYYYRRRGKAWLPSTNCTCLSSLLAGLALIALLAMSIVIPIIVTLSTMTNEMSSTTNTTSIMTSSSTTTSTSTTSTSTTSTSTTSTSTTSTSTITTTTTATTGISCATVCTSQETCEAGVCVGIGYLSCTLTWSRPGDGDIVLRTPNNRVIYWNNKGPSVNTTQGYLDVDDKNTTGPENIFWSNSSSVPLSGTYYVCFEPYEFNPNASLSNRITATVKVRRSTSTTLYFTRNFTSPQRDYYVCNYNSITLMGSFTYP